MPVFDPLEYAFEPFHEANTVPHAGIAVDSKKLGFTGSLVSGSTPHPTKAKSPKDKRNDRENFCLFLELFMHQKTAARVPSNRCIVRLGELMDQSINLSLQLRVKTRTSHAGMKPARLGCGANTRPRWD